MDNSSLVSLPSDLSEETTLRRTLSLIIEQLDIVVGNKNNTTESVSNEIVALRLENDILKARLENLESEITEVKTELFFATTAP